MPWDLRSVSLFTLKLDPLRFMSDSENSPKLLLCRLARSRGDKDVKVDVRASDVFLLCCLAKSGKKDGQIAA